MLKPYEINTKEVLLNVKTQDSGLSSQEAAVRLARLGPNKLPEKKPRSFFEIFFSQFQSPLIYILLAAAVVVFFLQDVADAVIIFLVLTFNAIVGALQEGKAQNTLAALKKFAETKATALRDGHEVIIPDAALVLGDIVVLVEGDKVPADIRVIESHNLRIDEAALTGESEPVYKIADTIKIRNLSLPDQKNMAFKSTHVVSGNGHGIVTATGVNTEIGRVSKEIEGEKDDSPLKADIAFLSKVIIWTVSLISIGLFLLGLLQGKSVKDMFTVVVALAVSIIPEGLPIVMTLVLAAGVWRMARKNALVKKLQAVESLGQAKVLALDKTGTITKNEMVVRRIYFSGQIFDITGDGYNPAGKMLLGGREVVAQNFSGLNTFLKLALLSANGRVAFSEEKQAWVAQGDPTQAALVCLGQKFGLNKDELEVTHPRLKETPFDYRVRFQLAVHKVDGKLVSILLSAPEVLIEAASLSKSEKEELNAVYEKLSGSGLRVIGIGFKHIASWSKNDDIKGFNFLGLIGIMDTIRPEAKEAVAAAERAGMKVVMITGDSKITAQSIAKEVGIYKTDSNILTGADIDQISDDDLSANLANVSVFARVTPEHKLRIIKAYKARGEIIAMTGDGVNDAPSLVAADLGVAMGKIGTEVAKEASDIVLLDDNFGNITAAMDEGRNIYKTIKKVILYLFSTSLGELGTITVALVLGYPLPVLASQIIWLNFVTDGFLVVSLGLEPKEDGLLNRAFFKPKKHLLDSLMVQRMLVMAIPMIVGSLIMFAANFKVDFLKASTIALTTLAVFQWFNAWNCRHETRSVFRSNFFGNPVLVAATMIVIFLQLFAVYNPFMQKYLHTTALNASEWLLIVSMASSIILVEEARKFFYRRS